MLVRIICPYEGRKSDGHSPIHGLGFVEQAVYAFRWALEHFCKEEDNVILYHVHQSVMAPVTNLGTGE